MTDWVWVGIGGLALGGGLGGWLGWGRLAALDRRLATLERTVTGAGPGLHRRLLEVGTRVVVPDPWEEEWESPAKE